MYGHTIDVEEASDIDIIAGKGVILAEDQTHVFADTDGYPNVHLGQVVNVYPGIDIDGDVGYETGHVIFDGHVNVAGSVKEGFKVKGTGLCVEEIVGAEIDVSGDVVVHGGIIGATIRTQGSVRAMYIRNITVSSYGNVVAEKQISDSTISASGTCHVVGGLIVTSDVSAKKGIRVKDAGTDMASSNRLRVGLDRNVEMKAERIKKKIADKNAQKDALAQETQKIDDGLKSVHNVIAEMAHFQDRILQKKAGIIETIEKFDKKSRKRRLVHGEKALEDIEKQLASNDKTMDRLFATQDAYQGKLGAIAEKQKTLDAEILECDIDRKAIQQWPGREKGDASIIVYGAVREKTVIYGVHSSRILSDTYKNVRIKEVRIHDQDSTLTHEIRVYDSSGISR